MNTNNNDNKNRGNDNNNRGNNDKKKTKNNKWKKHDVPGRPVILNRSYYNGNIPSFFTVIRN